MIDDNFEEIYRLTPACCLLSILHDYDIDITIKLAEHITDEFFALLEK